MMTPAPATPRQNQAAELLDKPGSVATGGGNPAIETSKAADEAQIRALIAERVRAVHTKDLTSAMSHIAPDILSFDVVNPLQYAGAAATRKRMEEWFYSFEGPIRHEIRELSITIGGDVAFGHSLNHVAGTKTDAKKIDMFWRATVCYRKLDGKWLVTHEHNSVPFDPQTGRASLGLQP